ncbi:hypothetical protein IIB34_06300 [PVC group bacterium]|nr:hypothetical protein [PVC group bacterium]
MVTIINLRIPWTTSLGQDNNFDVSRDQLTDPGNQIEATGDLDWGGINFVNLGTLNGFTLSDFLLNINNEELGDLLDVDPLVSSGPVNGDILFYDGAIWNRLPRGTDGQFLKSSATTIQWGTGIAQINDFSDADFRIFI